MSVISFVNQKGGCAKSTTAVHFAVWLQNQGKRILFIDADVQRTGSVWLGKLKNPVNCIVMQSADELLDRVHDLEDEADCLVIDGPAGLAETSRSILMLSDIAIVPCQPSVVDLRSADEAIRLIKQVQRALKDRPVAGLFVSRAMKGTRLKDETIAWLSKMNDVKLLSSVIHQRQIIADSAGQSDTVFGLNGRPAEEARHEYQSLFTEILSLDDIKLIPGIFDANSVGAPVVVAAPLPERME